MAPKTEHEGAPSGSTNPTDLLPHVLSLISPAMAPAHRPVPRPNMSDCPAQKLPVTHQSPLSLAGTKFQSHRRHSLAASIRCTGAPDPPSHQPLMGPFPYGSKIPVYGPLTLPLLDNGWTLVVGVLATPPVITTFYLSACRPASAGPAGEPHLPPDRSSQH